LPRLLSRGAEASYSCPSGQILPKGVFFYYFYPRLKRRGNYTMRLYATMQFQAGITKPVKNSLLMNFAAMKEC